MSASSEIAVEQAHVDRVYARLAVVTNQVRLLQQEGYGRSHLGHSGGLVERDMLVHDAGRRLRVLSREHDELVFGRLDLVDGEVWHIGRLGVLDESLEPLVIDWRAPAAAPFYRATAEDRMGVVRRRVIRCLGRRVVGVEDDLLDPDSAPPGMEMVGDGALLAALNQARGRQMRDIVATIQREQDRAIRAPAGGVTLLRGGPGTGKTVVALHRAAYILYRDRRRFEGSGVLVVGPSRVFVRYIEQVLPSLGEDSASLRSVGGLLDGVTANRQDEPRTAAVKGALRMRRVLQRAVREPAPHAPERLRLFHSGELLQVGARELRAIRRKVLSGTRRYNAARRQAAAALLDALYQQSVASDRADFDEHVRDRDEFVAFLRAWWPILTPRRVLAALGDPARLARCGSGVLSPGEVGRLAASWADPDRLSAHDVALLDEIRVILGPPPAPPPPPPPDEPQEYRELTTVAERELAVRARPDRPENYGEYGHIIIDEAQDLSPMQWRMLTRRGRYASWTIVGDAAQSAWPDPAEAAAAMDAALGTLPRHEFRLTTNYRNSAEIFELAGAVVRRAVPDADLPTAVRSTGHAPRHLVADPGGLAEQVRTATAELLDMVEGTVGVITTVRDRDEVTGWVSALPANRIQVVHGMDAKGMEYDAVLAVRPEEIIAESDRGVRILYVALTRATQRLTTISADLSWLP